MLVYKENDGSCRLANHAYKLSVDGFSIDRLFIPWHLHHGYSAVELLKHINPHNLHYYIIYLWYKHDYRNNQHAVVNCIIIHHLELVNLLLGVSKLGKVACKVTLVRRALLRSSNSLVHTRRTANKHLDILTLRIRKDSLQKLLANEALGTRPVLRGLVKKVESTEALRELVLELFEFFLEKDVLFGHVAEDEGHVGLVVGVLEDGAGELIHGGDAGAAADEGDVVVLVLGPGVLRDGSLEVKTLAGCHVVELV